MKKTILGTLICIFALLTLFACGGNQGGTYYPESGEMKTNLEKHGYTVTVTTDLDEKQGTHLSAQKESEYLEFYWLENSADCEYFYNLLEESYPEYHVLVQIENDGKFGNLVYCGTENAVEVSGINVVKVTVKI